MRGPDTLVSFHYDRGGECVAAYGPRTNMIGDSGAFSAWNSGSPIDIDAFGAWCQRWSPLLAWCAALDVIGDPEATACNWAYLCGRYGVQFVPTLHVGAPYRWLDHYAGEGVDFIGLGGGAGEKAAMAWTVGAFRYARDRHPGMRFHGWAATSHRAVTGLPWYSCDSTSLVAGCTRYGRLEVFDPATHRGVPVKFDASIHAHRRLLAAYGTSPADVDHSNAANRPQVVGLAVASAVALAAWLRSRAPVAAPAWGVKPGAPAGVRLHMADTSIRHFEEIMTAWNATNHHNGRTQADTTRGAHA